MKNAILLFYLVIFSSSCREKVIHRQIISLNGIWEIAKTDSMTAIPTEFNSKIEVPGLVDMSMPKIESQDSVYNNSVYWYKRSFSLEDLNVPVVRLKINKSAYHTWVFLNKKLVGENVRLLLFAHDTFMLPELYADPIVPLLGIVVVFQTGDGFTIETEKFCEGVEPK